MEEKILIRIIEKYDSLKKLREINSTNINNFFIDLETFLLNDVGLKESIWVNEKIQFEESEEIFGWDNIDSEWHIILAPREELKVNDTDEIVVYGGIPKKHIINCSSNQKIEVFNRIEFFFNEITSFIDRQTENEKKSLLKYLRRIDEIKKYLKTLIITW